MVVLRLGHLPFGYLIANTFTAGMVVPLLAMLNERNLLRWWSAAAVGALGGLVFASASGTALIVIPPIGALCGLAIWLICIDAAQQSSANSSAGGDSER